MAYPNGRRITVDDPVRDATLDQLRQRQQAPIDGLLPPPVAGGNLAPPPGGGFAGGIVPTDPNAPGGTGGIAQSAPNYGAAPPGFDAGKWGNLEHTSPKYTVGRALASNPNNPDAALAEIRKAFSDATLCGDRLDIPSQGISDMDVLYGLKGGAWQPQWLQNPVGGGQQPSGQASGGQGQGALDYGPMNSGSQGITFGLQGMIDQLLGNNGSLNNSFIRQILSGKVGQQNGNS